MKLFLAITLISAVTTSSFGQRVIDVSKNEKIDQSMFMVVNGEPFVSAKFVNLVHGSPYFNDEWLKGDAVTANGFLVKGGTFKIDLVSNDVHFQGEKGIEMIATKPLKELTLTDDAGKSFHFLYSSTFPQDWDLKKGWYLQLATGKATLLSMIRKAVLETKPYGSATYEQRIETKQDFYLVERGVVTRIAKIKDAPAAFSTGTADLQKFFKSNEGKYKSDAEKLTELVEYYNSL